jgi:hypothetical protein
MTVAHARVCFASSLNARQNRDLQNLNDRAEK